MMQMRSQQVMMQGPSPPHPAMHSGSYGPPSGPYAPPAPGAAPAPPMGMPYGPAGGEYIPSPGGIPMTSRSSAPVQQPMMMSQGGAYMGNPPVGHQYM